MSVQEKIEMATNLLRHFGPGWVATRAGISLKKKFRWYEKRLPMSRWEDHRFEELLKPDFHASNQEDYFQYRQSGAPLFFFSNIEVLRDEKQNLFESWDMQSQSPMEEADAMLQGTMTYFAHHRVNTGFPPRWHVNMFTKEKTPEDVHWSHITDFDHGDIKVIWEPNRFSFVYALVRAYARNADERYPEAFWKLIEDWSENNLPQAGANWKCGQEVTLRIMAWCFGLYGFIKSKHTTPGRVAMLAKMIALSTRRIQLAISYSQSQRNNHSVTEAAGLWTVGLLFPEFPEAEGWKNKGRELLESLAQSLIYEDGTYAQHSNNYHRTVLHDYLWAIGLGRVNKEPLSEALEKQVQRSAEFLHQIQDQETGKLPNYGQHDGALFLVLSNCSAEDYRPVIQAVQIMTNGTRCYETGPWDEEAFWLTGKSADDVPIKTQPVKDLSNTSTGNYTMRTDDGFLYTRCGTYRHRPSQADMMSVDLWWKSQNIALDPGTYSYNEKGAWSNVALGDTRFHNTVTIAGKNQMSRAGRFLWMPWVRGTMLNRLDSEQNQISYLAMTHDGYQKKNLGDVLYMREIVRLGSDSWLVYDSLRSKSPQRYLLHWQLMDCDHEWDSFSKKILLKTPKGEYHGLFGAVENNQGQARAICDSSQSTFVRADDSGPRGWHSTAYYEKQPALSFELEAVNKCIDFYTIFSPHSCEVSIGENKMEIVNDHFSAAVTWNESQFNNNQGSKSLFNNHISKIVRWAETEDQLEITG